MAGFEGNRPVGVPLLNPDPYSTFETDVIRSNNRRP